jgi:hypothetical protein
MLKRSNFDIWIALWIALCQRLSVDFDLGNIRREPIAEIEANSVTVPVSVPSQGMSSVLEYAFS